jgi:hypothetical protein
VSNSSTAGKEPTPLFSRYIVIVLALGVAALQASRGAWVEAAGLSGLGGGLVILLLSARKPHLKWLAWVAFAVTAAAMAVVALRLRNGQV